MARSPFYRKYIRPIKNTLAYLIIACMIGIVRILPRGFALCMGRRAGDLYRILGKRDRNIAKANIERAREYGLSLPDDLLKGLFRRTGENSAQIMRKSDLEKGRISIDFSAKETFDTLYNEGRGLIVLTGHIGPFELIPAYTAKEGYKTAVVGRKLFDPRINRLLVGSRRGSGIENVPSDAGALKLIRLLKGGYALGILADSNTRSVEGQDAPFFGIDTRTVTGPVLLARTAGLPLLPMGITKTSPKTFEIFCLPPIDIPKTADKSQDLAQGLKMMNKAIENLIERAPYDWMWYHRRFR